MENKRLKMIIDRILESIDVKTKIANDKTLLSDIDNAIKLIVKAYKNHNKVLFCGNGGSAADAQHLAAELSGKFYIDREPLEAEACHVNSSFITAVANDYNYDETFARYVKSTGKQNDILIGLSTSGNSTNIINAFDTAKKLGLHTIALTGQSGGKMKATSDILINVPSSDTPRVQEAHILIGHIICENVEKSLFANGTK